MAFFPLTAGPGTITVAIALGAARAERSGIGVNKEIMQSNNGRRLERNRKFVDSPLEGDGFELSVRAR